MTTNEKDPQTILRNAMESFLSDALEALALMVEEEMAKTHSEPEPDLREFLHDSIPVGHGWVVDGGDLFKREDGDWFTFWISTLSKWGNAGVWPEEELTKARPATVGDLRRKGVPISEWPDIEAPEPDIAPEPESEPVEPPDGHAVLMNGIIWQRIAGHWYMVGERWVLNWANLCALGTPTVIYEPNDADD